MALSCRQGPGSVTAQITSAPPKPHGGHSPGGLEHHRARHLRLAHAPVAEGDRHLDHLEAGPDRPERSLDLERVAERGQGLEVDRLQRPPSKDLEAPGEVPDRDAQRRPGVGAPQAADRAPAWAPVGDPAAIRVARAEHQVRVGGRLQQTRQVGRVVGEVGVHVGDQLRPARQRLPEPGHVRGPEAPLGRPVQDGDVLAIACEPIGDLAGAVGRRVVDDQESPRGRQLLERRGDDRLDVGGLVVGGNDEPDARVLRHPRMLFAARLGGTSARARTRFGGMRNAEIAACPVRAGDALRARRGDQVPRARLPRGGPSGPAEPRLG